MKLIVDKNFGQKFQHSISFYSNLYLHFLRPCCENIFKFVCIVSEKIAEMNLTNFTY